jgi:hypothetical protein
MEADRRQDFLRRAHAIRCASGTLRSFFKSESHRNQTPVWLGVMRVQFCPASSTESAFVVGQDSETAGETDSADLERRSGDRSAWASTLFTQAAGALVERRRDAPGACGKTRPRTGAPSEGLPAL